MNTFAQNNADFSKSHPAPQAPTNDAFDIYPGEVRVDDPFRPLETLDSPETLSWAAAQEARFQEYMKDAEPQITAQKKRLRDALDYPSESIPAQSGNHFFSHYDDGKSAHGVYRVRDSRDGEPRVLLDPNGWDAEGKESLHGTYPSPDGKYVAYLIAHSGSDDTTLRICDVATGKDLPDVIEHCRFTGVIWDRDSSKGFRYLYPGQDDLKRRVVKHHTLGEQASADPIQFEAPDIATSFAVPAQLRDATGAWSKYDIMSVKSGPTSARGIYIKDMTTGEPFHCLYDDDKTQLFPVAEVGGKIYAVSSHQAERYQLVAIDPANPQPEHWQTIIPEHPTDVMEGVRLHQGKLIAHYRHDIADRVAVHGINGAYLHDVPVPPHSSVSFAKANPQDTTLYFSAGNYQSPSTQYRYDLNTNTAEVWKESECPVNLKDAIVERIYATSKDGTQVPMTIIRKPQTKLDGTAATVLYGYGGFGISNDPGFSFGMQQFVEKGGIYAIAHIRGGGELGRKWHQDGIGINKQRSYDDFIAAAETLVEKKYTTPERLASKGGSNGGLLTLATMLQRPDLFGSVISQVPVTDMLGHGRHTWGSVWEPEYGNPKTSPEMFQKVIAYSPLHNIKQGGKYPPILLTTADHDDRVVPSHAYKFAAQFAEKADPASLCLLHVEKNAGHGAGKTTEQVLESGAFTMAFLEKTLGPISQEKYKATQQQVVNGFKVPQQGVRVHAQPLSAAMFVGV